MCFSADADLVTGIGVGALSIVGFRHMRQRRDLALAVLPAVLGVHLLVEALVWRGLEADPHSEWWHPAMWIYLVLALVVVPILIPVAVASLEGRVRWRVFGPFIALGTVVAADLLWALVANPPSAHIDGRHISYRITTPLGAVVVAAYIVATCGPALLAAEGSVRAFGLANLAAVAVLAGVEREGLISLWCAWAAVSTVLIVGRLRDRAVAPSVFPGSGSAMWVQLGREAAGCAAVFAGGAGATLLAVHWGAWRVVAIAVGFGVGRAVAVPITRGPILRVNPAATLLSWLEGESTTILLIASMLVQVWTMALVGLALGQVPRRTMSDLTETTSSGARTALVVFVASSVWLVVLLHARNPRRLGVAYGLIVAASLPLGGGSMNPARTIGPALISGTGANWWAFALPPLLAALLVGSWRRARVAGGAPWRSAPSGPGVGDAEVAARV